MWMFWLFLSFVLTDGELCSNTIERSCITEVLQIRPVTPVRIKVKPVGKVIQPRWYSILFKWTHQKMRHSYLNDVFWGLEKVFQKIISVSVLKSLLHLFLENWFQGGWCKSAGEMSDHDQAWCGRERSHWRDYQGFLTTIISTDNM